MWYLTKLAIKSRFITILLASILTAASIWGTLQLKMELIPDFELPFTTVLTIYPGGSPEQVADEVSTPIEEATNRPCSLVSDLAITQKLIAPVVNILTPFSLLIILHLGGKIEDT